MNTFADAASMVTDVSPWPSGKGFQGGEAWLEHVASKDERRRIDTLLGTALLDPSIRHRLIEERDESLFIAFGLSEVTRQWLQNVKVASLHDLAQAVLDTFQGLS